MTFVKPNAVQNAQQSTYRLEWKPTKILIPLFLKKTLMNGYLIFFLFFALALNFGVAYGEKSAYQLTIDENSFELQYDLTGTVIAMALDQELNSLLIGIENTKDSLFSIDLPNKMISSENNEFAVLVDGYEIDYDIIINENNSVLMFFIPDGTQEIEIIGTYVIPEFPIGAFSALVFTTCLVMIMTKIKNTKFR
ncbi:MAG: hypothetical protein IH841_05690 [Thaumarchaeota archaeon]|nr:hypothetical protein [Nitrososphaerota archaeon]